ncbi:hypothetical protein BBJ28_00001786 [Nothophytophthora sp. Chile5]|nr:hypothetical protein BBJ28_00001786 [Nothophytophthora sp. Chile5]
MRYAWAPYQRLKRRAVMGGVVALVLLFVLLVSFSSDKVATDTTIGEPARAGPGREQGAAAVPLRPVDKVVPKATPFSKDERLAPGPAAADGGGIDTDAEAQQAAPHPATPREGKQEETEQETSRAPLVVRLLLPLVAGFCFGFLGSVPIAGPTSAMVLKLGIQGKYRAGLTIAFGGAISEAVGGLHVREDGA